MAQLYKQIVKDFFKELEAEDIHYVFIGNVEDIINYCGDTDIDILVPKGHLKNFILTLKRWQIKHGMVKIGLCRSYKMYQYNYILSSENTSLGIQIDVFIDEPTIRGKKYFVENWRDDLVHKHGIATLSDEMLWNIKNVKYHFYNKGSRKLRPRGAKISTNWISKLSPGNRLVSLDNGALIDIVSFRRIVYGFPHLGYWLSTSYFILGRCFRPEMRGKLIIFLGVDGSGKSTLIKDVSAILSGSFNKKVYYRHLRPKVFADLSAYRKEVKETNLRTGMSPNKGITGLSSFMRWSYYLADYFIAKLSIEFIFRMRRNQLKIYDRYYYDLYIDKSRYKIDLPNWLIRLGELFLTKPYIVVVVVAKPTVIMSRKNELTESEIMIQQSRLLNFAKSKRRVLLVENNGTRAEASIKCLHGITKHLKVDERVY